MSQCFECNLIFENDRILANHIRYDHKLTIKDYREKYKLCYCQFCNRKISRRNKKRICTHCLDRSGVKNPFYGKLHSKETIEKSKIKIQQKLKNKWKEKEYREKVIKAISKPRYENFGTEQSERIKQWYIDNPEQRIIRRNKMKESWQLGKIVVKNSKYNESKLEKMLFNDVKQICSDTVIKKMIYINNKQIIPDILIPELKIIIEFFGDYWHANPLYYDKDTTFKRGKKIINVQQIWDRDKKRQQLLEYEGFSVIIVWQFDYINFKNEILNNIDTQINWECCSH